MPPFRLFSPHLRTAALLLLPAMLAAGPLAADAGTPAAVEGVVLYSDPAWGLAFLHDGQGLHAIEISGRPVPARGQRVRLNGTRALVRGRTALVASGWSALGPGRLPEPISLAPGEAAPRVPQFVSCEAVVREARGTLGRWSLRVARPNQQIDLQLPRSAPLDREMPEIGSRVRLTGVLEPAVAPWRRPILWVADWDGVAVTSPAPDWAAVPLRTAADLGSELRRGTPEAEVRLHGRAVGRDSLRSFEIEDQTGRIVADVATTEDLGEGDRIEVRGFLGTRAGRPVLTDARWHGLEMAVPVPRPRDPGLPVLTRVAAVRALSRAEAERGYPVRLRAVVTHAEPPLNELFVQDETAGIFVAANSGGTGLVAGDLVQLEGITGPGLLAPVVAEPRFTRLGTAELPTPLLSTPARLSTGQDDCRRVETWGIVRAIQQRRGRIEITLAGDGQRFQVAVPRGAAMPADAALVDARVRVRGVCGTLFNWRGLMRGIVLYVPRLSDLVVEQPARALPFELPVVAARDVLRGGDDERWGRLTRLRGVALKYTPGQALYLRDASGTYVAHVADGQPVSPGDHVDVVGFPIASPFAPRLEDAFFRVSGPGQPPAPSALDAGELLGGSHDANLVRLEATLLNVIRRDTDTGVLLRAGDVVLEARGEGDLPAASRLEPGSRVEVDGVLLARQDAAGEPLLRLALRGPGDVRLLASPPWWTPARAAWAVSALALVLFLSFAWATTLRRQVRKQTLALRRNEESYRLLAENASDVIVTLDRSLRLTYVSPSVERQTGYTPDEVLRLSLPELLVPESYAALHGAIERGSSLLREGGGQTTLELEVLARDGSRRWNEVRLSSLRDAGGQLTGYLGVARDVTVRRQAQKDRARLATAVEHAAEVVLLTDEDGKIRYVNPAFERITGYASAEVLGRTPAVLRSGVHDRAFYDAMWARLHAGQIWEGRFTNRRKDGTFFLEDASISPIRDESGRTIGYVAVKRDVTRQVQLEAHVAQAHKLEAVGRLAAGVAHDFNNLLAAILGFADLMLRKAPDERFLAYVKGIREAALRGAALTRQILAFSRQSPAEMRPVELGPLVDEAARLLHALLPANVRIRVNGTQGPALVATADANQMHQVILNLGTNGGLAMREKGGILEIGVCKVELDAAFAERHPEVRPGPHVKLTVTDTGCGMRSEVLERIFEPFFTTRMNGEGTGMGLSVAHGIVHRHGGVIVAESEPGRGSTFSVYLPAACERPPAQAPAALAPAGEGERILFVDDEPTLVALAEDTLGQLGYRVTAVTSPLEALERFRAEPFDLVIADLSMPELDGARLAARLREIRPVPTLLCTGYGDIEGDGQIAGCEVLTKPLSVPELAARVRRALERGARGGAAVSESGGLQA